MKNYVFAATLIVACLLLAGLAQAVVVINSGSNVALGGQDQERGQYATTSFAVADSALATAHATVSFTLGAFASGYSIVYNTVGLPAGVTLDSTNTIATISGWDGSSKTLPIKSYVPLNHNAVDATTLQPVAPEIATVSSDLDSVTQSITMQAANHLEFDKIKITVAGTTKQVKDGNTINNIHIGDTINLDISGHNTFSGNSDDNTDVSIDSNIKASTKSSDDLSIDTSDSASISSDSTNSYSLDSTTVDETVSDKTYSLTILLSGKDDNKALHGEKAVIKLQVKRNDHEIQIRSATLSRSTVSCDSPTVDLTTSFVNIGTHDEDNVEMSAQSAALGIDQNTVPISLNKDDAATRTLTLSPKLDKPGTYSVDIVSYYLSNIESNRQSLTLTVAPCESTTPTTTTPTQPTTPTTTVVVAPPSQPTTPVVTPVVQPTTPTTSTTTARVSTSSSPYTVPLLIAGVVLAALVLVLLLVVLLRPREA